MSDIDFTKRMSKAPDEELLTVISSEGFLPAAVDAAKAELERRNLKPDDLARMSAQVQEVRSLDENKPLAPLSLNGKLAFFAFGPFLLFTLGATGALRFRGYRRKSNEAFKWMFCSLLRTSCLIMIIFNTTLKSWV